MTNNISSPLYSGATPVEVADDLAEVVNFQREGLSPEKLKELLETQLLPHLMQYNQPGFQSMFNAFAPTEAKVGAQMMLDFNQGVTNWQVSPGGAMLEELCCQSLCRLFGLGANADATFMYSGTYANQQALYMALHRYAQRQGVDLAKQGIAGLPNPDRPVVLVSQDAHFSLKHAVRMLGLGEDSLITVPVDSNRRIDAARLCLLVKELQAKHDIVCMVATSGTTSTGAVDPIEEMADLCEQVGVWLHVDGAYGYAYKLVPEWTHLFAGDDRADSISWDPHKQLGVPIPNSVLFVKDRSEFGRMSLHSSYFNRAEDEVPNPGLKSAPSTRPMSALPLVTLLRGQGTERVINDLRSHLVAIKSLADYLQNQPDIELWHQPDTGIICFRMKPGGISANELNPLQQHLYEQMLASGQRSISITKLDGVSLLRLVVVSPHTTFHDLQETIDVLRQTVI